MESKENNKCYITKWLYAKDLKWMKSEIKRLEKKGWNMDIDKKTFNRNGLMVDQYALRRIKIVAVDKEG